MAAGAWSSTRCAAIAAAALRYGVRIVGGRVVGARRRLSVAGAVAPSGAIRVMVAEGGHSASGIGRLVGNRGGGVWRTVERRMLRQLGGRAARRLVSENVNSENARPGLEPGWKLFRKGLARLKSRALMAPRRDCAPALHPDLRAALLAFHHGHTSRARR